MARIMAKEVISTGRKRTGPAISMASSADAPFLCARLAKSTSKTEFLTTNPISMMKPIIAVMSSDLPLISSAMIAPTMASGMASMIRIGWSRLPNWLASTM